MKPRLILVVDDSKTMRRMYELMLRQYPLLYADDGRQALERLREREDVELVLLDVNVQTMEAATALLAELREKPHPPTVVAIATEGSEGSEERVARALEAGAMAYIKKPFQSEELLAVIAQLEEKPRRE